MGGNQMARIQVVVCDRCKVKDEATRITPWTARRGQRRYQGDLCDRCWDELINLFHPSSLARSRHQIEETPLEIVP